MQLRSCNDSAVTGNTEWSDASQPSKEQIMKHVYAYLGTHQAAALWTSVAFMVSVSAFALLQAFDHLV